MTRPHILKIRVSRGLLRRLTQICKVSGLNLESWGQQTLEVVAADYCRLRYKPNIVPTIDRKPGEHIETHSGRRKRELGENYHEHALDPPDVQRLLHLYDNNELNTVELSRRFGCGISTVRRILAARKPPTLSPPRRARHRGGGKISFVHEGGTP